MNNPFSLENKKILITGASSGIGKETAIQCAKMGATIIALGRNKPRLENTLKSLSGEGHSMFSLDLNDSDAVTNFVAEIENIDGIVNSAGVIDTQLFNFLKEDSFQQLLNTNLVAPIMLIQKLVKNKKINKGGSIVFISSIGGPKITSLGLSSYAASKGAINAIAKTMALELSSKQIRVNCIMPGMVRTELLDETAFSAEDFQKDEEKYPFGYGKSQDVAFAAIYLLSEGSKWVTGTNLKLDGGFTLR